MGLDHSIFAMQHTEEVRKYYENNTPRFLRLGKHVGTQNIHQALWAEGVETPEEAVSYSNKLVLEVLSQLSTDFGGELIRVLDLGCGGRKQPVLPERAI